MHLKRWITALVAAPFLIFIISKGGVFTFSVCISIASCLAFYEYSYIVFKEKSYLNYIAIPGYLFSIAIIWANYLKRLDIAFLFIIADFFVCAIISLFKYGNEPYIIEKVIKQVFGIFYTAFLISFILLIRNTEHGILWIYLLLCLVFAGDAGAFYAGRSLGKHKLCPAVSPNKTIEGSLGGLFLCIITGSLIKFFFIPHLSWQNAFLMFIIVNIMGQIGDLFESELKRFSKIKDSGNILPGHGGILDRIDALLFAAPVVYFFKEILF